MNHVIIPERSGRLKHTGNTGYVTYGNARIITLECLCDCGNIVWPVKYKYISGHTSSCGCLNVDTAGAMNRTHGYTRTRTYRIYANMKSRCYNNKFRSYRWYGARGVQIDKRWLESFENFFEDMGECPSKKHTIDRIDNSKGYEKANCRWATYTTQANNRSNNRRLLFDGEMMTIAQISNITSVPRPTISNWLNKYKLPDEVVIDKIRQRLH